MADGKPARADARRNRQRLIDVALEAFTAGDGSVALESIARAAGVGIGTLYRHFPSREALVEAVYRSELARLCHSADDIVQTGTPAVALREWMGRYAEFVATKRDMGDALGSVIASGAITSTQTRADLRVAVALFLDAGASDGTLRDDVLPEDVTASMAGIVLAARESDQVGRMLDLLVAGLKRAPDSR